MLHLHIYGLCTFLDNALMMAEALAHIIMLVMKIKYDMSRPGFKDGTLHGAL